MGTIERLPLSATIFDLLREAVESGEYGSENEALHEAFKEWKRRGPLRDLEAERLRTAWNEGLASGDPVRFSVHRVKPDVPERFRRRLGRDKRRLRVVCTPAAEADLNEIRCVNRQAATRLRQRIDERLPRNILELDPQQPGIAPDFRVLSLEDHYVMYRCPDLRIEIVRVMDRPGDDRALFSAD